MERARPQPEACLPVGRAAASISVERGAEALTEAVKGTAILLTVPDEENLSFYRKAGFRMHKRVMALGYRGDVYAE